ncbi:hypothetical protein HanPI659440_Chr10g0402011 [Helianthus annuus]|nr:hypothetical protein HanPI659440_Chr10g0402011 [Helianthus annuus]
MSIKSSAYEPGRIYSAGNHKFNFASEIFVEALVCRCLLPFTTTVRSNGYYELMMIRTREMDLKAGLVEVIM